MGAPAYKPPTLLEEINRKSFETLEFLVLRYQRGQIDKQEFQFGLDILFMAVSGLVSNEFFELITEAQKLCEGD